MIRTNFTIIGEPVGKPRWSKSANWNPGPGTIKYRAWADKARTVATGSPLQKIESGHFVGILAYAHFTMPKSWPKAKRDGLAGKIHEQTPDTDNCLKSLTDALFQNDAGLAFMQCIKYWAYDDEAARFDVFLLPNT
jgi:Holliday junction resolvase RusA-like endonuclease